MTRMSAKLGFVALLAASPALAQETVYALSPDQVEATMQAATRDRVASEPLVATDRRIHGEVGAMVGTGGSSGVFGTIGMPIGDTGFAAFSFERSRFPRIRYRD